MNSVNFATGFTSEQAIADASPKISLLRNISQSMEALYDEHKPGLRKKKKAADADPILSQTSNNIRMGEKDMFLSSLTQKFHEVTKSVELTEHQKEEAQVHVPSSEDIDHMDSSQSINARNREASQQTPNYITGRMFKDKSINQIQSAMVQSHATIVIDEGHEARAGEQQHQASYIFHELEQSRMQNMPTASKQEEATPDLRRYTGVQSKLQADASIGRYSSIQRPIYETKEVRVHKTFKKIQIKKGNKLSPQQSRNLGSSLNKDISNVHFDVEGQDVHLFSKKRKFGKNPQARYTSNTMKLDSKHIQTDFAPVEPSI